MKMKMKMKDTLAKLIFYIEKINIITSRLRKKRGPVKTYAFERLCNSMSLREFASRERGEQYVEQLNIEIKSKNTLNYTII